MTPRRLSAVLAIGIVSVLLGACGGSDKPAYCSDSTDFKDAVSGLTNVKIAQNGVDSLTAAVDKVQTSGQKLVSDAKSAFPSETSALNASITALAATGKQLTTSQDQKAALVAVPAEIKAVQSAYDGLASAIQSKCG
jgi:hypothetical protein